MSYPSTPSIKPNQAKAIHVASCIETRCAVHRLVFERLIDGVGTEGSYAAANNNPWGAHGPPVPFTIINTNHTTAHGGAAAAQTSANSHAAATATAPGGGGGSPIGALLLGFVALGGGVVRMVVAVVWAVGGMVAKLVTLGSLMTAARAILAVRGAATAATTESSPRRQPAWAGAGAGGGQPQAESYMTAPSAAAPQPPAAIAGVSPAASAALSSPRAHPLGLGGSGLDPNLQQQQQPFDGSAPQPSSPSAAAAAQVPYFEALRPTPQPPLEAAPLPAAAGPQQQQRGGRLRRSFARLSSFTPAAGSFLAGAGSFLNLNQNGSSGGGGGVPHQAAALWEQRRQVFGRDDGDDWDVDGGWGY
jgi:hypothetical protein